MQLDQVYYVHRAIVEEASSSGANSIQTKSNTINTCCNPLVYFIDSMQAQKLQLTLLTDDVGVSLLSSNGRSEISSCTPLSSVDMLISFHKATTNKLLQLFTNQQSPRNIRSSVKYNSNIVTSFAYSFSHH